jgi:hypothetical protein
MAFQATLSRPNRTINLAGSDEENDAEADEAEETEEDDEEEEEGGEEGMVETVGGVGAEDLAAGTVFNALAPVITETSLAGRKVAHRFLGFEREVPPRFFARKPLVRSLRSGVQTCVQQGKSP